MLQCNIGLLPVEFLPPNAVRAPEGHQSANVLIVIRGWRGIVSGWPPVANLERMYSRQLKPLYHKRSR